MISSLSRRLDSSSDWFIRCLFPIGWLALLTGMFWIGDRSLYHKLYYLLLAAPTLLVVVMSPRATIATCRAPAFLIFLAFSLYACLSLAWAPDESSLSQIKHPIYILMLLIACSLMAERAPNRLRQATLAAAVIAAVSAALSIGLFINEQGLSGKRFEGYGALYNPLLTGHVYGFFATFWIAALLMRTSHVALSIMGLTSIGALIVLTGSRTPLLALTASTLWLLLVRPNRYALLAVAGIAIAGAGLLIFFPEIILKRGFSYRPELWMESLQQISEKPWLGHGYGAHMRIYLESASILLSDPHNLSLGVAYQTGIVGLAFWLILYGYSLSTAWQLRKSTFIALTGALVVYGFIAGMTEGSSFMSRPKEHWFLIWIPLALHFAAIARVKKSGRAWAE